MHIKKRGQNSNYLFFEVLDYLNHQIMNKAHAKRRERLHFTLDDF
jgi:hypothetical protein